MPNILDPRFQYVSSALTNIRVSIERERERIRAEAAAKAAATAAAEAQEQFDAADLHPALPAWLAAHAADERADIERARSYLDTDTRR